MSWRRHPLRALGRLISDADYRALATLRVLASRRLHQTTVFTAWDRYPEIFRLSQTFLAERERPRILSFGCATGEEVLTLRSYFPSAEIVGAEINAANLAVCRSLTTDAGIRFIKSGDRDVGRHAPFDAIFCMAVLQRTPHLVRERGIADISPIYPFEKFDRQVRVFDRTLKLGGLLAIEHSQYRLEESSVAGLYRPLRCASGADIVMRFDRSGRLLDRAVSSGSVFEKIGSTAR